MNERTSIGVAALELAALCCGGPLLISLALGTAGTAGLLAWFSQSVVPALFIALGLVSIWLYRRRSRATARVDPGSRE